MIVQTALQMHAHKCEACAAQGKEVIWVHPDLCRGKVAVHKCPECGTVQWKQCKVASGKLPQVAPRAQGVSFETTLGYVLLFVGLALLGYGMYLYIKDRRAAEVLPV